jgi:hypothetical protein
LFNPPPPAIGINYQDRPIATSLLPDGDEPALLRVEQDTIRILKVSAAPNRSYECP